MNKIQGQTTVLANNAMLQYQGRINFSNALSPVFSWPGTSVKMKFNGTAVAMLMQDQVNGGPERTNFYTVVIDNQIESILSVNPTNNQYTLASGLAAGPHLVEVIKRTESSVGNSLFNGFVIDGAIEPLNPPSERHMEIVGDSWSAGYGNESNHQATDPGINVGKLLSANEDHYFTYGSIISRRLNAQLHCTAFSGKGMARNAYVPDPNTMPILYQRTQAFASQPTWNHSNFEPDLTLIFLGTNDFAAEANTPALALDSSLYVNSYIAFVTQVRTTHPQTHILMVFGGSVSDYWPAGKRWLSRWRNYITAIKNHFANDPLLSSFELSQQMAPYGDDWHPSKATHESIANQLTPFIQQRMGWNGSIADCMGILGGTASLDNCGNCRGGNSHLDPCMPLILDSPASNNDFSSIPEEEIFQYVLMDGSGKTISTGHYSKELRKQLSLTPGIFFLHVYNKDSSHSLRFLNLPKE